MMKEQPQFFAAIKLRPIFNNQALNAELDFAKNSSVWVPILEGRTANVWTGVALRSHDGATGTMGYKDGSYKDTPLLKNMPYCGKILDSLSCEKRRVRLLSLMPGGVLGEHRDVLEGEQFFDVRLHVPITTNRRVEFNINGHAIPMSSGELWFIDVSQPHSVANHGTSERVHLVIDCVRNEWLDRLFSDGQPFPVNAGPDLP